MVFTKNLYYFLTQCDLNHNQLIIIIYQHLQLLIEKKTLDNLINVETICYLYFIICVVETFTNRSDEYKKPVKKKRVHALKNNKANSYKKNCIFIY